MVRTREERNYNDGERMAVLETKVDTLIKTTTSIDNKIDETMQRKADKEHVQKIENRVNKFLWWIIPSFIVLLVTIILLLIKQISL